MTVVAGAPPRHTPGFAGYLVAVAISVAVTGVGLAVIFLPEDGLVGSLGVLVVGTVYAAIFAAAAGPPGVVLVHLACRHVASQWVHVLVAGLAGVVTGLVFAATIDVGLGWKHLVLLVLLLGYATALGRAAVIPLVQRHPTMPAPMDPQH